MDLREQIREKFYIIEDPGFGPLLENVSLDKLANFMEEYAQQRVDEVLAKIDGLIAEEILVCHEEHQPTSRLTSLAVKINSYKSSKTKQ